MRYPEFLKDGGTIGFAAPSFGAATEPYRTAFSCALKRFYDWGFKTVPGPNVYNGTGIGISSTPRRCGEELTQMYLDASVDAIISVGGGEMMCETMDYVDFDAIRRAAPKFFMGYSDNTNMTFLLTTLCDVASVYGPCAPAFGQQPLHPALKDALALLQGKKMTGTGYARYEKESLKSEENPLASYNTTEPRVIRTFVPSQDESGEKSLRQLWPAAQEASLSDADPQAVQPVRSDMTAGEAEQSGNMQGSVCFEGRLVGGCLDCLANLCGTRYDHVRKFTEKYAREGIVWFLESCDLNVFAIRRAIWELKSAGWFSHAKGFLIGRPYCNGQVIMGLDQYRAVTDELRTLEVPALMDLDIGHQPPQMPLLCGCHAKVSCRGQQLKIEQELL